MSSFFIALNAVIPFLIYISFGYFVRAIHIVDEEFMNRLNQMVFKAFFPIMMFFNLYHKESGISPDMHLVATGICSLLILVLVLFITVPRLVKGNPQRGVIIQAIYRSNFVLFAIPLTESIFGESGTAIASMMVAIIVPLYNLIAIITLEYFRGGNINLGALIKRVLSNPLIMGAIVGFIFVFLKIDLPACIEKPISQFSDLSTPLALFVLGGTLHFSSMKRNMKYLIPSLGIKLIIIPALSLIVTVIMDFAPLSRFVLFTMFATPVAASSYPMAASMGGDGELAGEMVVLSTAVSVITIFLWVFFMKSTGLI